MATLIEEAVKLEKEQLEGYVKLQGFRTAPKKGNGEYGVGNCYTRGGELLEYKIWDEPLIKQMEQLVEQMGQGFYIAFKAVGNIYQGKFSLSVIGLSVPQQDGFNIADYIPTRLSVPELMTTVNQILGTKVTDKGRGIVQKILTGETAQRFVSEFAGKSMHDAEPIGLLNHTTKMMQILDLVMMQHNNFGLTQDGVDLMYVGVLIHDIGKIRELKDGLYTDISVATHRGLGAEMIFALRTDIIKEYGEMWYYNLLSIILQHHGQHEERPRTVYAYIAHQVDNFESRLTIIDEKVQGAKNGQEIYMDDFRLTVEKQQ